MPVAAVFDKPPEILTSIGQFDRRTSKVFSGILAFRKPKYPTENGEVGKLQPFGARRN
jgi:hypothetical protein